MLLRALRHRLFVTGDRHMAAAPALGGWLAGFRPAGGAARPASEVTALSLADEAGWCLGRPPLGRMARTAALGAGFGRRPNQALYRRDRRGSSSAVCKFSGLPFAGN